MIRGFKLALLVVVLGTSSCAATPSTDAPARLKLVPLTIQTQTGKTLKYSVEVAESPDQQARGLMFRENLASNRGMIFPMDPPRVASFWMKNTLIPLDMIFVRTDGSIAYIAKETTPMSLEPVSSGEPVAAVLELAGGETSKSAIAEGDIIKW